MYVSHTHKLSLFQGGFAEITPYVNSALTYKPKGAGPISNHNGYTLYGDSNVYAVYYGQSSYFNGEPAQCKRIFQKKKVQKKNLLKTYLKNITFKYLAGSGTVYNQPFADALDEFLMNFGATSQWKTTQAYGAGGLKFNMRTGLRIDETSSHYLGEGSFYGIEDTFTNWFASLISSKKLPNDPVSGIYVIIISEGENLRSSSSNSKSWVISSKGETQLNGQFADCSVHSYSEINSNFYFWAMISIPQMGTQSQNCFSRQMNAMGLTSDSGIASVIKRLATM